MFKHAFDSWGLENVEDMTAEQYTDTLEIVHEQLRTHQHLRKAWKLEHDQGPSDVTERDTEQAWYSGQPTRYTIFVQGSDILRQRLAARRDSLDLFRACLRGSIATNEPTLSEPLPWSPSSSPLSRSTVLRREAERIKVEF